ncbi:hypothetical protein F01_440084 [Burkholderia cenocepacia]|nr:hypothetical protein F01_440084 [Burkholderia cenocepacia]
MLKPLIPMKNQALPVYLSNNVQWRGSLSLYDAPRRSIDSGSTSNDRKAHQSISGQLIP